MPPVTIPRGFSGHLAMALGISTIRALGSAFGFGATFMAARVLGPGASGVLFGTLAWASGLAILARWGSGDRIMLAIPPLASGWRRPAVAAFANREMAAALVRTAMILMAAALAWAALAAYGAQPAIALPLLLPLLPMVVALQLASATCKAAGRTGEALLCEFVLPPALVLLVAVLAMAGLLPSSLFTLGSAHVAGALIGTAAMIAFGLRPFRHWRRLRTPRWRDSTQARNFALIEIGWFLNAWLGVLLLPFLLSAPEAGVFNLAFRIVASIGVLLSAVQLQVMPRLVLAHKRRDRGDWEQAIRQSRITLAALAGAFLLALLLAGPLVMEWAGTGFSAGTRPLLIMGVCFALATALGPSGAILAVVGAERRIRNVIWGVTVLTMLGLPAAAILYGVDGAAAATGLGLLLQKLALLACERDEVTRLVEGWKRP